MIVAEITRLVGQPASRTPAVATVATTGVATSAATLPAPLALPAGDSGPASDAWTLRRLRLVARRRVRVEVASFAARSTTAGDDEVTIRLETVSSGDPRVIAWNASRPVDLVVVHDGCGARVVGDGGRSGVIELPGALAAGAALSFCYDTDPGSPRV